MLLTAATIVVLTLLTAACLLPLRPRRRALPPPEPSLPTQDPPSPPEAECADWDARFKVYVETPIEEDGPMLDALLERAARHDPDRC